jgi:hypothetical protein
MLLSGREVRYVSRQATAIRKFGGILSLDVFTSQVHRNVPWNWIPEADA